MSSHVPESVVAEARRFGVALEGAIAERLADYLSRLLATNEAFNLTAVTAPDEAWTRHILDSLTLVPELDRLEATAQIVDVGSGGGLPGLPLAIARPSVGVTLLETTAKKARFLEQTADALGLDNVKVVCDRAETFGQGAGRERFDGATSRALSRLPVLLELTLPLVRVGGVSLAIKGEQAELEVSESAQALARLHGVVEAVTRTGTGSIIRVRKTAKTPARYPRRPGEPKRKPL